MAQYWYVKFDDKGTEVDRKEVTRGRPPVGYTKVDEAGNQVTGPIVKAKTNVDVPKQKTLYVKYDAAGAVIEKKEVTRGRPPKDFTKVTVDDAGNITGKVEAINVEEVCEKAVNAGFIADIDKDAAKDFSAANLEKVQNADTGIVTQPVQATAVVDLSRPQYGNAKEIISTKHCDIAELNSFIEFGTADTKDGIMSLLACDIKAGIEKHIDYLAAGMSVSRIDIDNKTGDVLVWRVHTKGDPDVIIKNAINTLTV